MLKNSESEYLPSNIGAHFPELTDIFIESNSLKFITRDNFKFMEKLEVLSLDFNGLSELSNQFDDLVNLVRLDLSSNQIKVLPIKLLKKLKELFVFKASFNAVLSKVCAAAH